MLDASKLDSNNIYLSYVLAATGLASQLRHDLKTYKALFVLLPIPAAPATVRCFSAAETSNLLSPFPIPQFNGARNAGWCLSGRSDFHACGLCCFSIGRPMHMHAVHTACCSDLGRDVQQRASARDGRGIEEIASSSGLRRLRSAFEK